MIRHCVFLRLRPDHSASELADVLAALRALCADLPGAGGFIAGPNRDFEGKSVGYPCGFTVDFEDANALRIYAEHPEHRLLGARLVALCSGGADGIVVYDLEEV